MANLSHDAAASQLPSLWDDLLADFTVQLPGENLSTQALLAWTFASDIGTSTTAATPAATTEPHRVTWADGSTEVSPLNGRGTWVNAKRNASS